MNKGPPMLLAIYTVYYTGWFQSCYHLLLHSTSLSRFPEASSGCWLHHVCFPRDCHEAFDVYCRHSLQQPPHPPTCQHHARLFTPASLPLSHHKSYHGTSHRENVQRFHIIHHITVHLKSMLSYGQIIGYQIACVLKNVPQPYLSYSVHQFITKSTVWVKNHKQN